MSELPVFTIQLPNPVFEGRNRVYAIATDPVTLIDTGIASQRSFDALVRGLEEHGLPLDEVGRVILTHKHIDHIGNAWRIQQQTGAEILIHERELHAVTNVDPDGKRFAAVVRERLSNWNVPSGALPRPSSSSNMRWEIESAEATGLSDGQRIGLGDSELEVIHTPGHTMGSVCLKYGRYLFSGDHVLPNISPNIGGGDLRQRGLLRHYLCSLNRIRALAGDDIQAMPGHGDPFSELEARCDHLLEHHRERLNKIIEILASGGKESVYQVACELFGNMEQFHVVLGCAEAAAHLEYLEKDGRVVFEQGMVRLP